MAASPTLQCSPRRCLSLIEPFVTFAFKIRELLKEFLSSGDKDEASKCLRELDVPHFHHELVFEAILIAMEAEDENVINQMTWLLQYMFKEVDLIISLQHT